MWQMRRAEWKEDVAARAAHNLIIASSELPDRLEPGLDFRRFHIVCDTVDFDRSPTSGTGRGGTPGWLQKASCRRGDGRDAVILGLGISDRPEPLNNFDVPLEYSGRVLNVATHGGVEYMLYAEQPLTGLIPVAQPTPEMVMTTTPDGHRGYAMQWFLFAAMAIIFYVIALRRRVLEIKNSG